MRSIDRPAVEEKLRSLRQFYRLIAAIVGVTTVVGAMLFTVSLRVQHIQLGYELYSLQRRKVELTQQRSMLELEIASLKRPDRLASLGRQLGLQAPSPTQVLSVTRSGR
ncbi:MAG: hypothetical protein ACO3JL_11550 [Myxococcota bacterium]